MARPKEGKDRGFLSGHQTAVPAPGAFPSTPVPRGQGGDPDSVPYIPSSALNRVYETGAAGFPTEEFVSPEEKRIEELEQELENVKAAGHALSADGTILVHDFQLTPSGLIAPEDASFEAWEHVGHLLFRLEGSIQWLLGDWLACGAGLRYGDIPKIAEAMGRDASTLHSYKQMAQNIEYTRRRVYLSFAHHQEVRALSHREQDYALSYAEEHRFNRSQFRQWIKEQFGKRSETPSLNTGEIARFKPLLSEFKKIMQHDPTKAEEYVTQLERTAAEMRSQLNKGRR